MEIAIIGLGSWGLSFLERIVTGSRSQWGPVRVHVVEPGTPGSGVYAVNQPDYLILNTPCGQVSLYPWQDEGPRPATPSACTSGSPPPATAGWATHAGSAPPGAR